MAISTLRHIVGIGDLSTEQILHLFDHADAIRTIPARARRHQGRIIAMLFYEPSTRTRLSFESAALRLGAQIIGFSDPKSSSAAKGETLIDTIRTVQRYCDVIVLRHPAEGAATLASKVAAIPIINAGDGGHEHPTQTLFDLYTIRQRFRDLSQCTIGYIGDLKHSRTVHSLVKAAAMFHAEQVFVAPAELQIPQHLIKHLQNTTQALQTHDLAQVIERLDVLYATRLQVERLDADQEPAAAGFMGQGLTQRDLAGAKEDLMILHPLPRVDELHPELDLDERSWYFEQVANGVLMRMALLDQILAELPESPIGAASKPLIPCDPPWREQPGLSGRQCTNSKCVTRVERQVMPRSEDMLVCHYCGHLFAPG